MILFMQRLVVPTNTIHKYVQVIVLSHDEKKIYLNILASLFELKFAKETIRIYLNHDIQPNIWTNQFAFDKYTFFQRTSFQ